MTYMILRPDDPSLEIRLRQLRMIDLREQIASKIVEGKIAEATDLINQYVVNLCSKQYEAKYNDKTKKTC